MGCCFSTHKKGTTENPKHHNHHPSSLTNNHHVVSKSLPRAEEEAAQEVLPKTSLVVIPAKPNNPDLSSNPNPNPYYYTPIPKINHGIAANGFPIAILAANNSRNASPRKQAWGWSLLGCLNSLKSTSTVAPPKINHDASANGLHP